MMQVSGARPTRWWDPTVSGDNVDAGAGLCSLAIAPLGYQCEEHQVVTKDGYILSLQRIPFGMNGSGGGTRRQPVLLQHGVLVDGMTWLLNSPEESLAFILADSGFDVWISNTRGTRFSRGHVSLNPTSRSYWDWSWDELVANDLPAIFDFVYEKSGQKLHYVGHSLGTLVALASFSEGRLVDKLKSAALLSPVAYLTHMQTPLGILCAKAFVGEVKYPTSCTSNNINTSTMINILKTFCHHPGVDCYDLMTSFTGINCCLNASTVDLFLKYEPQPTSTKTMVHLAQTFRDGVLTKYDYVRKDLNMESYGRTTPPVYNLTNIPADLPMFLSYGGKDCLSDVRDVEQLLDDLKFHRTDKLAVQFLEDFAHADFVMGVTAKQVVYPSMTSFFHDHDN
ncbi:triacylglycerol lipase 2 [Carex littledalei]|uniref:Lipase n=1 Tax=Carex littledalei TaxID=544730 RepID=A0A833V7N2_9POAL|nr:triacylglycerol lipase 2 [Carex littledalei]